MRRSLAVVLALAVGVPLLLHAALRFAVESRLEPAIGAVLETSVDIAGAEATLGGTLRLDGVRVGAIVAVDRIEGSVGLGSLLAGRLQADVIEVRGPRLQVRRLPDGELDLARLLRRARDARRTGITAAAPPSGPRAPPRIVVTGGELLLSVDEGRVRAQGVELRPQAGGVRVVTGTLSFELQHGTWKAAGSFERAGLDLAMPDLDPERAVAGGGRATISGGGPELGLRGLAVSREKGRLRLLGQVMDGSPFEIEVGRVAEEGRHLVVKGEDLPLAWLGPAVPPWLDLRKGHAGGVVEAWFDGAGRRVAATVSLRGVQLDHDVLAPEAVPVTAEIAATGSWRGTSVTAELQVQTGAARLSGKVDAELHADGSMPRARMTGSLARVACADLLAAVPVEMRRPLDGLDLTGELDGTAILVIDRTQPGASKLDVDLDVDCAVTAEAATGRVSALSEPLDHELPTGVTRRLAAGETTYVRLGDLPRHVYGAFVAGEDARFFQHDGFDGEQLEHSLVANVASGKIERGGSTISQQLVKNLFLTRDRTFARKLPEAVLTWQLESRLDKRRILELYLNVIELGEGIYGIRPAARAWFGKEPADLTIAEAAFLAVLTPAPVSYHRRVVARGGGLDAVLKDRVEVVLRHMRQGGHIDPAEYDAARGALPRPRVPPAL